MIDTDGAGPDAGHGRAAADAPAGGDATLEQIARLKPREIAVGVLTYNNAGTAGIVAAAARDGLEKYFPGIPAALIDTDAGSSDGTAAALAAAGVPIVSARHEAPIPERAAVPFHGVPGRGAALRMTFGVARELGVRVLVLLEADVTTVSGEWVDRLARPVWEQTADLVTAAYARHRYDGTITNLLVAPLVRALYGRRLRHPLAGAAALSARLIDHLLIHPRWNWTSRDVSDLWITGTAIADGFGVAQAWLGRHHVESRTRTMDLPSMVAQTVGAVFTVMDRHEDLWVEVRGSEPLPMVGEPVPPSAEPIAVDTDRMMAAFQLGARDLGDIWEHIMAAETFGDVLELSESPPARFRFPDDLWARVVYDFALGHHYGVVYREHLLRSLVPLYLGKTAAFVLATQARDAAATEAALEAVALAFERQKPYLVARWR
jgi:hypothetical protein